MNKSLPQAIYKLWIHSYEEDQEEIQVYRPEDYCFPPSRGRGGFKFESNGNFVQYRIGPTDQFQSQEGTWELSENKGKVDVNFEASDYSLEIQILSVSDSVLKVEIKY